MAYADADNAARDPDHLRARHHHRVDPPVPAFRPAAVDDIGWPQQRDPPDRAVHLRDRVAAMGTGLCLGRSAGAVRDDPDRGDGAILAVLAPGGPLMRFGRTHPVALTLIVIAAVLMMMQIGRASVRERVCQYV